MNIHTEKKVQCSRTDIMVADKRKNRITIVCNAVLNFVIRFLEGLCGIKELSDKPHKQKVLDVIGNLRKCVGTGQVPKGFKDLVGKIGEKVKQGFDKKVNSSKGDNEKLNAVFSALKGIIEKISSSVHQSHKVDDEAQNVQNYIDAIELKQDGSGNFQSLNDNLQKLLGELKSKADDQSAALDTRTLTSFTKVKPDSINRDIHTLRTESKFKNYANAAVFTAVRDAATAFLAEIKEPVKYTSYYDKSNNPHAEWNSVSDAEKAKCAKIFLGCLPLYYQALTYIYWGCHDNGGRWRNLTLANGAMRSYFDSQGLLPTFVESSRTGTHIAESALGRFSEFGTAASPPLSSSPFTYASFAEKLQEKVNNAGQVSSECPLSVLFYGASCYFRYQQIKNADKASKSPKTIREMLYFLAALQFSSAYDELNNHIGTVLQQKLNVADSGLSTADNTLSAADLKSHLASTFLLPPAFIGVIQEPTTSGDPWLHSHFSNSQFNLSIPSSGATLFSTISNYAYALQFQLHFLYQQCNNSYTKACGWNQCSFGQSVNSDLQNQIVESHICPTGCTSAGGVGSHDHTNGDCQHAGCGQDTNKPSPLQAVLTDRLKGFSRSHHSDPSNHLASCSGYLCHVPMGFESHRRDGSSLQGGHISLSLKPYCGSHNTPFRQLSGKLTCLCKRAPRSLGDLFGFYGQVTGQLFNDVKTKDNDPSNQLSDALSQLVKKLTTVKSGLLYDSITENVKAIGRHFFGLSWHCHRKNSWQTVKRSGANGYCNDHTSNKACDLMSLYDSECTQNRATCGKYLEPLVTSSGATFANGFAFTCLSWAAYLTDDLYESLQEFLESFNDLKCTGCKNKCRSHSSSGHGSQSSCKCRSVVECSDVLPHLYANGFSFHNAFWLRGRYYDNQKWQDNTNNRSCEHFHTQLLSVINGKPLQDLFESIDSFLYLFRFYFFYNQSAFWTIYVCIILYTFFFLLDTLHLRSHLHFPSSNSIPPVSLLGTGKAPALTKLTKLTYVMP
ncbi:variant erythrocyte surface antigen-1 family protein [Babesia caballi]|uniref:Variant erythrocyte surface antigen-1 family protein n=1 Tax=Babesia caballi TaxID=5871 RepID=A0AAV4LRF8_BABCB|nr:variant erythrocyte surface antigen-1 family protein [Babesia caballi]